VKNSESCSSSRLSYQGQTPKGIPGHARAMFLIRGECYYQGSPPDSVPPSSIGSTFAES
jgi:hypothetical protein